MQRPDLPLPAVPLPGLPSAAIGMSAPSLIDVLLAEMAEMTAEQAVEFARLLAPFLSNGAGKTPPLISAAQAGHRLGIHPRTLTRAAAAGRVPGAVRVGRSWRFRPDELEVAPPARSRPAPPPPPRRRPARGGAAAAIRGFPAQPTEEDR